MNIYNIKKALGKHYNKINVTKNNQGETCYSILGFCKAFELTSEYDNLVKSLHSEYLHIAYAKDPVTYCPVGRPSYYTTYEGLEHIILNSNYEQLSSIRVLLIWINAI